MFREDLRTELYNETGKWYTDDELDTYMKSKLIEYNLLLKDDLINEISNCFTLILKKLNIKLENKMNKIKYHKQISGIGYFTKLCIYKYLLYILLQNEKNK